MFAAVSVAVLLFLPRTAYSIPFVVFHGNFPLLRWISFWFSYHDGCFAVLGMICYAVRSVYELPFHIIRILLRFCFYIVGMFVLETGLVLFRCKLLVFRGLTYIWKVKDSLFSEHFHFFFYLWSNFLEPFSGETNKIKIKNSIFKMVLFLKQAREVVWFCKSCLCLMKFALNFIFLRLR